jgi:hypothetical protein
MLPTCETMARVYTGILDESVKNIDQIFLVVNSFTTQMSDAKRLDIINAACDQVESNYNDLRKGKVTMIEGLCLSIRRKYISVYKIYYEEDL